MEPKSIISHFGNISLQLKRKYIQLPKSIYKNMVFQEFLLWLNGTWLACMGTQVWSTVVAQWAKDPALPWAVV